MEYRTQIELKVLYQKEKEPMQKIKKSSLIHKGSKFYNDGLKNYKVLLGDNPDSNWVPGFLPRKRPTNIKTTSSICPHCGLVGSTSNMKRWHFDNCKHKLTEL